MTLEEIHSFTNFLINKYTGSWYTPAELDEVLDRGQMSLFAELRPKYATSQRLQEALAPFLAVYDFDNGQFSSGVLTMPADPIFIALLDIQIQFQISNRTVYGPVVIINKDERANRLNSQLDPVTPTSPIAEVVAVGSYRFYPTIGPYTGYATYFRRPKKPQFKYTLISGRVIVFDPVTSVNLEWPEWMLNAVIMKSLSSLGVNLSDQEIAQYAEAKTQQNSINQNNT